MEILDVQAPLYQVSAYGDFLYRVTKRLCGVSCAPRKAPEEWQENTEKLQNALVRAKTAVREYCLCNRWQYFITLTINGSQHDRYDLQGFLREFMQWMQNLKKTSCPQLRYILVPEQHKKEDPICGRAWHFHGLISGITPGVQLPGTPKSIVDTGFECWPLYSARYGFSTVSPIKDAVACGFYVSKYITKTTADMVSLKGVHTYYHSRGLQKSIKVGSLYVPSVELDSLCRFRNSFYATGFFKCENVGDVVAKIDVPGGYVEECYGSWLISDPVTGEVSAIVGGESSDLQVFEQLAFWGHCGVLASPVGDNF